MSTYTKIKFSNAPAGGITAQKLNLLVDDLSTAIAAGGGVPGTGDMTKAVYDTNNNGKVDTADSIPWGSVSGTPATFPPDSTAMLKSVYDTNADNIVDHAALSDTAPWTGISGKPSTFAPSPHASSHNLGGSDAIAPDWTQIANKPASFVPAVHAATHKSGGTDPIKLDELAVPTDVTTLNASNASHGLCPKLPSAGTAFTTFLRGDGTFSTPPAATATTTGYVPTPPNDATKVLRGDGAFGTLAYSSLGGTPTTFPPDATAELVARKGQINGYAGLDGTGKVPTAQLPAFGTGDMLKSVYDTNADSIIDHAALADAAPWTGISGKPATFPPDATAMLKSVYDANADNIVDHAALADAAPWTGITGKPATFAPSAHASTHLDNGTDIIPVVTATRTGLAPKLNGNAATFLDGTGSFSAVSGSVNPGTWTNLSLGSGWTAPTQAQYRVEVNGLVSTVYFRGMIQAAYSAMGTTAFTAPAGAQPSMTRSCVLGGAQNTGTPSDIASYLASVSSAGVCTIYFLCAAAFVWANPAQTQQVFLDGLFYSL